MSLSLESIREIFLDVEGLYQYHSLLPAKLERCLPNDKEKLATIFDSMVSYQSISIGNQVVWITFLFYFYLDYTPPVERCWFVV